MEEKLYTKDKKITMQQLTTEQIGLLMLIQDVEDFIENECEGECEEDWLFTLQTILDQYQSLGSKKTVRNWIIKTKISLFGKNVKYALYFIPLEKSIENLDVLEKYGYVDDSNHITEHGKQYIAVEEEKISESVRRHRNNMLRFVLGR